MSSKKKNNKLPVAAIRDMAENMEESERLGYSESKKETFKRMLARMDRYRDYFFSDEWPDEWDQKKATEFTPQDLAFIHEDENDFADRAMIVITKKCMTKKGLNSIYAGFTYNAFYDKFIKPEFLEIGRRFIELTYTTQNPEYLLERMLENPENGDSWAIHESLIELLQTGGFDRKLEPIIADVLTLVHKTELNDCKDRTCEYYIREIENRKKT